MADINAADLTAETLNSLDGTENIVAFDTAEGKKIPISVLADYVMQKKTQTIAGSTQTVKAAVDAITNKTQAFFLRFGRSANITFSKYQCAALIFGAISNVSSVMLVYTNGYLAPVATTADFTTSLSSDYKTITITNNSPSKQGYIAVQEFGNATFTIEEVSS